MRTISAKKLSLEKARGLGLHEEPVTIGDCELYLRNLRPDEYEASLADCAELDEMPYLNAFQKAHVSRAICAINGVDLRDVDFIEDEEPTKDGKTRNIKIERHVYVRKHVVDSWSKEAVYVAYRKFLDIVAGAEKKASDGIVFNVIEESAEEKFRRLLGDLKEIEVEVPEALLDTILEEAGYARRTTLQEAKAAEDRLAEAATGTPPPVASEEGAPPPVEPKAPPTAIDPVALMRQRVPISQTATVGNTPVAPPPQVRREAPPVITPPPQPVSTPVDDGPEPQAYHPSLGGVSSETGRRVQPPGSVPQAANMVPGTMNPNSRSAKIEAELAAQEEELGYNTAALLAGSSVVAPPSDTATLTRQPPVNPTAVKATIDRPPVVGINPRFKPPPGRMLVGGRRHATPSNYREPLL